MTDPLLKIVDAATQLNVRPSTVLKWCRSGRIAGLKVGHQWRVPQSIVDAFPKSIVKPLDASEA